MRRAMLLDPDKIAARVRQFVAEAADLSSPTAVASIDKLKADLFAGQRALVELKRAAEHLHGRIRASKR